MNTKAINLNENFFSWDTFLMGGFSIIVCMGFWAFMDSSVPLLGVSRFAFAAAFLVNHPHFLSSYVLLYGDFSKSILTKPRYLWAGVIVPVLLGGFLITAFLKQDTKLMGYIISSMYFFVGWHYVKQVFGCVIVTSAQRKIYYTNWERKFLLMNLFSVWFMSWLGSQVGSYSFDFYGISYYSLDLPQWTLKLCYAVVAASLLTNIYLHIKKYIDSGIIPSPPGVAAYLALYAWYVPLFSHRGFGYLIPFFHSMQYLAFVWVLKRNQVIDSGKSLNERAARENWVKGFLGFVALVLFLGACAFEFIPKSLDAEKLYTSSALGTSPFLAAFLLFINIHHYFIDNAIWRSDNEIVKKYLFQKAS